MSEKLGNLVFGSDSEVFLGKDYGHVQNYSEKLASIIDEETKLIIDEAYTEVQKILKEKIVLLNTLANTLIEKEKIEGPEFEAIFVAYADQSADVDIETSPADNSQAEPWQSPV